MRALNGVTSSGRSAVRVFAILAAGTWSMIAIIELRPFGVRAPLVALTAMIRSAWWMLPVLVVVTFVLVRARRLVSTPRDAWTISAVIALLLFFGVFVTLALESFVPAGARLPYAGAAAAAALTAAYALPWFAWCLTPRW